MSSDVVLVKHTGLKTGTPRSVADSNKGPSEKKRDSIIHETPIGKRQPVSRMSSDRVLTSSRGL